MSCISHYGGSHVNPSERTRTVRDSRVVLDAVLTQIDYWWKAILWPRIQGLTDEEYDWEPAPGCWTLSRRPDGTRFYEWPPGSQAETEPPFTTISWRMAHIGSGCLAHRAGQYFGVDASARGNEDFPGAAAEAVQRLADSWLAWRSGLGSLAPDDLWRELGPGHDADGMGLGPSDPFLNMVLHNHRELMHHGAEINLLRDLWWAHGKNEPFVAACLVADRPRVSSLLDADPEAVERARRRYPALMVQAADNGPDAVRLVAELGFEANPASRRSPLHAAAFAGNAGLVTALLEAGADPTARDPQFDATPAQWARYRGRNDVAKLLEDRTARSA